MICQPEAAFNSFVTCSASLGSRPIPSNGTNLSFAQTFAQEVTAWEFTWVKGLFHFICILLQAAFSKWVLFNIWSPKHGWSIYFCSLLRIQNLFKNSNIAAIYFKRGNRAGLLVCFVENAGSLEFPLKNTTGGGDAYYSCIQIYHEVTWI